MNKIRSCRVKREKFDEMFEDVILHVSILIKMIEIFNKESTIISCSKIVLVAIQDEGSSQVSPALNALKRLGAKDPILTDYRCSFALIGYSKPSKPSWIAQEQQKRYEGPSEIFLRIPLMQSRQLRKNIFMFALALATVVYLQPSDLNSVISTSLLFGTQNRLHKIFPSVIVIAYLVVAAVALVTRGNFLSFQYQFVCQMQPQYQCESIIHKNTL